MAHIMHRLLRIALGLVFLRLCHPFPPSYLPTNKSSVSRFALGTTTACDTRRRRVYIVGACNGRSHPPPRSCGLMFLAEQQYNHPDGTKRLPLRRQPRRAFRAIKR